MLALVRVNPCQLVKAGDLTGDLHRKLAGIEARNASHAAATGQHSAAKHVIADAVRTDYTHAGDDDSSFHRARVSFIVDFSRGGSIVTDHAKARKLPR
jgi:hypothetical protein